MVSHEGMELIEPGKYACDKCNENFLTKSLLDLHNIEEHLIIGPLKCSTCFETFNAFSELKGKFNNHSILYLCIIIIERNRKCPLRGYMLSVLKHTIAWDQHWGGDKTLD